MLYSTYAEIYAATWDVLSQPAIQGLCAAYLLWLAIRLAASWLRRAPNELSYEPTYREGE